MNAFNAEYSRYPLIFDHSMAGITAKIDSPMIKSASILHTM